MTLSVVIVIASDTVQKPGRADHLRHCLRALHAQERSPSMDIVVPHLPDVVGIQELVRDFPNVRFVQVVDIDRKLAAGPCRDHHDELRARGLEVVHGDIVALLEDHEFPARDWAAQVIAAHRTKYAGIGGAVENSVNRPLNWAVFFCDFGRYQNPITPGATLVASDVNVSYKRHALQVIADVWRTRFHERLVHAAMLQRGMLLALNPSIVVYQHRVDLTLRIALRERLIWGRSYASTRAERWSAVRRLWYSALSPVLPAVLVVRLARNVVQKRHSRLAFVRALPFTLLLTTVWAIGELLGYAGMRSTMSRTAGRPVESV
jgi:hypothetical protein